MNGNLDVIGFNGFNTMVFLKREESNFFLNFFI